MIQGEIVSYQIYLCDLPVDCTDEQLSALLQHHGALTAVEWLPPEEDSTLRRAVVTVDSTAPLLAIVGQLNQRPLGDQPVVASPAVPPETPVEPSKRQIAAAAEIAAQLGEKKSWPRMMIRQTVGVCGVRFAQEMVRRAQAIDAAGGMLVPDGSRRRTVGGTFFTLSRQYVTPEVGRYIFHETKRALKAQKAGGKQAAEQAAPPESHAPADIQPDPPASDSPEALDGARQKLDALREEMSAAQAQLKAVQSGQAPRTTGVFSLLKRVVDTQKAIDALLAEHPGLRQ